jgi:16S rRNA (guanine966-N2)-methyltransferase
MRVIGGEFRSRRLKTLPGLALRPTQDRLRETLFDILASRIAGTLFLDAYAGSGAVGIEALSRGAARAIFIESHRGAVEVIRQNLKSLGLADIVFLDPPYDLPGEYDAALRLLAASPPPLAIAQHPIRLQLRDDYGLLHRTRLLTQGDNALSFFERAG